VRKTLLALALVALTFGWALPASAHAQLAGSSPAVGAILHAAPTHVAITFDGDLIDLGTSTSNLIQVANQSGKRLDSGATRLSGATLDVDVTGLTASGIYTVTYSVVSEDGHPVSNSYQFQLISDSTPAVKASSSKTPVNTHVPAKSSLTSTPSPSVTPSGAQPSAVSTGPATPSAGATSTSSSAAVQPWLVASLTLLVGIVVVAGVLVLVRRVKARPGNK
jgi:methionine-rich copper-binding protein CopC